MARLYGKDGKKGGKELRITAQVTLTFTLDGQSANVPVFVQPDSSQDCLLGTNAMPFLGIKVVRGNRDVLLPPSGVDSVLQSPIQVGCYLVEAVTLPSQRV